jgi:TolC family type I secretion outer membrane protein
MMMKMKQRIHRYLILGVFIAGGAWPATASAAASSVDPAAELATLETLDLTAAARLAVAGNPGLAAAADRVRQAKARLDQARATWFPRLDASAAGTRVDLSENDYQSALAQARFFNPSASVDDPRDNYAAGLTATWVLFNGFEREFSQVAARHGLEESEASRSDARRLLLDGVVAAYYGGQLATQNLAIAAADKAFFERQLKEAEARYNAGTGALSDILNFKIRLNAAEAERIATRRAQVVARHALAALLGLPGAHLPEDLPLAPMLPEREREMAPLDPAALIAQAMEQRPDLQRARLGLRRREANLGVARAGYWPTLSLNGGLEADRTDDVGFGNDDVGSRIGLNLTINLFEGGATRARIREAQAAMDEGQRQVTDLKIQVNEAVRNRVAALDSAREQLLLQRANAALVRENRDLVEKAYQAGQGSLVRLNEAQRDLNTAQSRLALALVSLRQAWYGLQSETGSLAAALGIGDSR